MNLQQTLNSDFELGEKKAIFWYFSSGKTIFFNPWKVPSLGLSVEGIRQCLTNLIKNYTWNNEFVCFYLLRFFWVLFCVFGFYCFVWFWFWCFVFLFFLSVKSKTLIVLLNGLELLPSYQLLLQGVLQTIQGTCGVQKGKMLAFGYSYFFIVSFCLSILIETVKIKCVVLSFKVTALNSWTKYPYFPP